MKQENILEQKRSKINSLGLDKIESYFDLSAEQLQNLDAEQLKHLYNMARLGMQFEKEVNVSQRATESNFIRIGAIITENKEELKQYIKRTLPQYT